MPADAIFDRIDPYGHDNRDRAVYPQELKNWLRSKCGFDINNDQLVAVHRYLDNSNPSFIGRDAFINSVAAREEAAEEEEEAVDEGAPFEANRSEDK